MLAGLVTPARAQEAPELHWEPVVEVRQRFSGELTEEAGEGEVAQRARVGLEVERRDVTARVSLQDVRLWATTTDGVVYPVGFAPEIAEAWGRVAGDLSRNIGARVQIGRQPIEIHEGRLIGDDDFAMGGQFFDAIRVRGFARPVELEYVNARRFVAGEDPFGLGVNVLRVGLYGDVPLTRWVADALWVVDARRTDDRSSTGGLYAKVDSGRWRWRAEGYLQGTDDGTGGLIGLSAGRVFGRNERVTLYARYDGLSADHSRSGLVAWRPVLGDRRHFNGLIDRFATPEDSEGRGLADLQLAVEVKPIPQIEGHLAVHHFRSPRDGDALGTEADLTAQWWFSPFGALVAGGGWLVPDPGFERQDRRYGYLELDVRF